MSFCSVNSPLRGEDPSSGRNTTGYISTGGLLFDSRSILATCPGRHCESFISLSRIISNAV